MSEKGTNVEMAPAKKVDDAVAKGFKLDPYVLDLLFKEPFYGAVMRKVNRIRTQHIPTAGVAPKGEDQRGVHLYWNPNFVAGLSNAQVRGLIKHECWHIVLGHIFDRRMEPHLQWNYATDWAINCHIPDDELPEGGLRAGHAFNELTPEQLEDMSPQQIQDFNTMSAFQEKLPKFKSSEWYFAELMRDKDASEALDRSQGGSGEGEGEGEAGGIGNPGMPGTDDHSGWADDLTDEEREVVKGKVKKLLEDAAREADGKGNWGTISAEGRATIRAIIRNEIPWQSVLKKFCGMTRRSDRTSSIRRLSRKYPGIHPGHQKNYTSSIAVYIDQSGSVSNDALELLFGELAHLAKHTEFVCYHFDTSVDEASETTWRKGKCPPPSRTRCGGTCFKAPAEHANKNKHRFDGYLILTDGEAPDPGPTKLKRGWVIVPGRSMMFTASKRDFVINMKAAMAKAA